VNKKKKDKENASVPERIQGRRQPTGKRQLSEGEIIKVRERQRKRKRENVPST
jgi:hypothetical protein